jgi:uncharacterized protein YmfQ (DUF2313 family)
MLHSDILNLLIPVALGGDFATDLMLEGLQFDCAQSSAARLVEEAFADTASELFLRWEALLDIVPDPFAPRSSRVSEVLMRLRSLGRLDRDYFIQLAAALGYDITITELQPSMAGILRAGDTLRDENAWFVWEVTTVSGFNRYFHAGLSAAGDPLMYPINSGRLRALFEELKPAHTFVKYI